MTHFNPCSPGRFTRMPCETEPKPFLHQDGTELLFPTHEALLQNERKLIRHSGFLTRTSPRATAALHPTLLTAAAPNSRNAINPPQQSPKGNADAYASFLTPLSATVHEAHRQDTSHLSHAAPHQPTPAKLRCQPELQRALRRCSHLAADPRWAVDPFCTFQGLLGFFGVFFVSFFPFQFSFLKIPGNFTYTQTLETLKQQSDVLKRLGNATNNAVLCRHTFSVQHKLNVT